jgi:hypothetical protein
MYRKGRERIFLKSIALLAAAASLHAGASGAINHAYEDGCGRSSTP